MKTFNEIYRLNESEIKPINQFKHNEIFEDNEYYWDEDDDIDWDATHNREMSDREKYDSFLSYMPSDIDKDSLIAEKEICNPYNIKSRRQWNRHTPIFKREHKQPKIGRAP